jgi:hypothetical protein
MDGSDHDSILYLSSPFSILYFESSPNEFGTPESSTCRGVFLHSSWYTRRAWRLPRKQPERVRDSRVLHLLRCFPSFIMVHPARMASTSKAARTSSGLQSPPLVEVFSFIHHGTPGAHGVYLESSPNEFGTPESSTCRGMGLPRSARVPAWVRACAERSRSIPPLRR